MKKKKLLLIAYHFPPEKSGGVERPYSLFKNLPLNGYDVTVLTAGDTPRETSDGKIHRVPSVKNWKNSGMFSTVFFWRLLSELISRTLICPFSDLSWYFKAKRYYLEKFKEHEFDLVYASFPPFNVMFLASYIQKVSKVPLVVECRDGMGFEPLIKRFSLQPLVRYLNRIAERIILSRATLLVTIGRNMCKHYQNAYPQMSVAAVHNGFQQEVVDQLERRTRLHIDRVRVIHFGSIGVSRNRTAKPLFQALYELKNEGTIERGDFDLTLMGRFTREERKLVCEYRIDDIVKFRDQVDKVEGLQEIINNYTHVLLYGVPGERSIVTSKLFDYFLVSKPIIGVCKGNEAAEIIEASGLGDVCGFTVAEIKGILSRAIEGKTRFAPDLEYVATFNRVNQTRQIASLLDQVLY